MVAPSATARGIALTTLSMLPPLLAIILMSMSLLSGAPPINHPLAAMVPAT